MLHYFRVAETWLRFVIHLGIPRKQLSPLLQLFFYFHTLNFLFTSLHLLLASRSYNSHDERVSSAQLLYDHTITFLHSEHIPYAVIALLVILTFNILPLLLLLLYPTSIFKKCLTCLGFRRWDVLNHIMDIFQGWYKDGAAGTRDYRPFSALYMLYRIMLSCELIIQMLSDNYHSGLQEVLGILNVSLEWYFLHCNHTSKSGWITLMVGL